MIIFKTFKNLDFSIENVMTAKMVFLLIVS